MISDKDNYIIINYHYVEDSRPDRGGINPCAVAEFRRQMKFIAENFRVLTVPNVFQAAVSRQSGRFCAITFDDCLKGVWVNAVPILKKYNLVGTFFAITATFEGLVPSVHKVHALLSKLPAADLIDIFNDWAERTYPLAGRMVIPKDHRLESKRSYDDTLTANFKEVMILLPNQKKAEFIEYCFKYAGLERLDISRGLFMTSREVRELYDMGMVIGSHTHTHGSLEVMGPGDLTKEIRLSSEIIKDVTGARPLVFSYPHGRWLEQAARVFSGSSIRHAVTIEKRGIRPSDGPFFIPRYDTNDLRDYLDAISYQ